MTCSLLPIARARKRKLIDLESVSSKPRTLAEIRDFVKTIDIVDVLEKLDIITSDDVTNRKMICPFHDENTPSMHLYEDSFKCYGCGAQGDTIKFVQDAYDFSYYQAINWIAEAYNIEIANKKTNPFIQDQSHVSLQKLEREWQGYLDALEKQSNFVKKGAAIFFPLEVGYDPKINYYVLRYTSKNNKTLGFTKRRAYELTESQDKSKHPKWKHSSIKDSNISQCGNIYNLGMATKYVRQSREVILVEGPKDCIPFILQNKKNVVAVSSAHGKLHSIFEILPEVDKVILAMDGDNAGKDGEKSITEYLCQKFDLDSISWVDFGELDPFDYYQEHKNTPEPKNILSLYNENELKQLYQHCSVYNKDLVTKYLMPLKQVSYSEAESFFEMKGDDSKKIAKRENEIERLSKSKDEKALRKMKLKYGVE